MLRVVYMRIYGVFSVALSSSLMIKKVTSSIRWYKNSSGTIQWYTIKVRLTTLTQADSSSRKIRPPHEPYRKTTRMRNLPHKQQQQRSRPNQPQPHQMPLPPTQTNWLRWSRTFCTYSMTPKHKCGVRVSTVQALSHGRAMCWPDETTQVWKGHSNSYGVNKKTGKAERAVKKVKHKMASGYYL